MLYNSLVFVAFFLVVYSCYLALSKSVRAQNWFLLAASYFFYAYWDWRFLGFIAFTTVVDYNVGLRISKTENARARKSWLLVSLVCDLTVLGFFKYFNFFTESFLQVFRLFGLEADSLTLKLIMPIGISFYTFQSLSYTIDVYKRRMEAVTFLPDYAVFVSMFPQLLSGPIARAKDMLPQIVKPRAITADNVNAGLFLILWGYFKKVVVADNLAKTVNLIFDNYKGYHGLDLIIAVLAFSIQIYGDFSGYSDIARGIAKLMGFELMLNFKLPYFALSPSEFWSRWHISLSSWFRDYLYWPLANTKPLRLGSRTIEFHAYRNMIITMLIAGLWHGASWNFIFWGGYLGIMLMIYRLIDRSTGNKNPWKQAHAAIKIIPRMALMYCFTLVGWVLFRCHTTEQIAYFFTGFGFSHSAETLTFIRDLMFYTVPIVAMQLWQYRSGNLLVPTSLSTVPRVALYAILLFAIFAYGARESGEFIYLQF